MVCSKCGKKISTDKEYLGQMTNFKLVCRLCWEKLELRKPWYKQWQVGLIIVETIVIIIVIVLSIIAIKRKGKIKSRSRDGKSYTETRETLRDERSGPRSYVVSGEKKEHELDHSHGHYSVPPRGGGYPPVPPQVSGYRPPQTSPPLIFNENTPFPFVHSTTGEGRETFYASSPPIQPVQVSSPSSSDDDHENYSTPK